MKWKFRTSSIYEDAHHSVYVERSIKKGMKSEGWLEYNFPVDSLNVAFSKSDIEVVVDFEGGLTKFTKIISDQDDNFYVCSNGQLYYFSPCAPQKAKSFQSLSILESMTYMENTNTLICWDASDFFAVCKNEILWGNVRVSFDGIKEVIISDSKITGKGWSAPNDRYLPFELDISNGELLTEPIY